MAKYLANAFFGLALTLWSWIGDPAHIEQCLRIAIGIVGFAASCISLATAVLHYRQQRKAPAVRAA